jgi:hypothetical protein
MPVFSIEKVRKHILKDIEVPHTKTLANSYTVNFKVSIAATIGMLFGYNL